MADKTVVTELIIDARGAEAGSAMYVKANAAAQAAVDRLYDREQAASRARQASAPAMVAAAGSIGRVAGAWDRLRSSIDPVAAAEIKAQRAIEQATVAADNAVKRGLATEVQAAETLQRLRAQQVVDLDKVREAQQRLTQEQVRGSAAANDNSAAMGNTANVAAQFQDIFVTAQMGQNPLQIALQQGTQLSAVFGPLGAAGAVKTLGTAFLTLINPVSLITIGLVAAAAAAIQFGLGMMQGSEEADDALKSHLDWLDKINFGYKSAQDAAQKAADAARTLPQASVESNLGAKKSEEAKKYEAAVTALVAANLKLKLSELDLYETASSKTSPAIEAQREDILALQSGIDVANPDLDTLHGNLTRISNTTTDETIKSVAQWFLQLVEAARTARGELDMTAASLEAIAEASDVHLGGGDMDVADNSRLNKPPKKAGGLSPQEKFDQTIEATTAQIEALELQNEMFGRTTFEVSQAATALDLFNAAQKAGLEVTPEVQANIDALATRFAEAKVQAEGLQTTLANQDPFDALRNQLAALDEQLAHGAISWEIYEAAKNKATMGTAAAVAGSIAEITSVLAGAFENNKALAAANIVVSTAAAAMKALEQGGMFAWPMAAAITAAGAMQLATVLSAKPGSSSISSVSGSGSTSTTTAAPQAGNQGIVINLRGNPTDTTSMKSLAEQLQEQLRMQGKEVVIQEIGM